MRIAVKSILAVSAAALFTAVAVSPASADVTSGEIWFSNGAGKAIFNADPSGSKPGDAIRACDDAADGWGIKTYMDIGSNGSVNRTVSTQGHNSPYCTGWATGNLEEGTSVTWWGCMVKGTEVGRCTTKYTKDA
ncbi:hypothetical protein YW7DRAFT_04945 [Streptomyces sp. AmelKG-E11A]|nr:hypothetical protein YW7DRAFT_04945 [Streptomyces sp. AmelKG-E11A]